MRDILFRGKTQQGEWVLGDLLTKVNELSKQPAIVDFNGLIIPKSIKVIPETVGQYTGLQDKNGTKIFEGDIVMAKYNTGVELIQDVVFDNCRFALHMDKCGCQSWNPMPTKTTRINDRLYCTEIEIIGNVFDNPELLKEK